MSSSWRKLCTEENRLVPSIVRHIHHVGKQLIRINMSPDEPNIFGKFNRNQKSLALLEENYIRASELVNSHVYDARIRVPKFLGREDNDLTIWEFIEGEALSDILTKIRHRQLEGIKIQLREFIASLWQIPPPTEFAVGSLCSTHELLCENAHPRYPEFASTFWTKNGPYKTVDEFHSIAQNLYPDYQCHFPIRVPLNSPEVRR